MSIRSVGRPGVIPLGASPPRSIFGEAASWHRLYEQALDPADDLSLTHSPDADEAALADDYLPE